MDKKEEALVYVKEEVDHDHRPAYDGQIRRFTTKKGNFVYTTDYPTGNCQLSSISYINALLLRDMYDKKYILKFLIDLKTAGRILNILLCDVKDGVLPYLIDKIGEKYIMTKTNYISTNGSNMWIVLINVKKICEDYNSNILSLK